MFTSETKRERTHYFKTGFVYLIAAVFCALFGAVYEHYSHEVYSYYMIYAFAFPLVLGTLPFFIIYSCKKIKPISRVSENLYNAGIGTLTVGSIIQGVLIIYGTTNSLTHFYWIVGVGLIVAATVIYITECVFSKIGIDKSETLKKLKK